jgi:hypothetical protein
MIQGKNFSGPFPFIIMAIYLKREAGSRDLFDTSPAEA